jgi:hypothetical protein
MQAVPEKSFAKSLENRFGGKPAVEFENMICPKCRCEYIRGVTQCAECGVPLVDALDPAPLDGKGGVGAVSVWKGNDPGDFAIIKDALEKAGIRVVDHATAGHLFFPSAPARTEIYVSGADVEQAKKVLRDLSALYGLEEMTAEERQALELPESDLPDAGEENLQPDSPEDWREGDPVAEVWSGDSEGLAENLTAFLREVGIGAKMLPEADLWRLVVRLEHEARAKEVVREVMEASPPE